MQPRDPSARETSPLLLAPGSILQGRYELGAPERPSPLYRAVRARDRKTGRRVVLWLVRSELFGDGRARERFVTAAERARLWGGPTVRPVLDVGMESGTPFVALPADEGPSLAEVLARRRSSGESLPPWIDEAIAAALDCAHDAGLAHGLLTPADVVLLPGQPVVQGIGVWESVLETAAPILSRHRLDRYLAPEVRAGGPATPRSDVFSLAAILDELDEAGRGARADAATQAARAAARQWEAAARPARASSLLSHSSASRGSDLRRPGGPRSPRSGAGSAERRTAEPAPADARDAARQEPAAANAREADATPTRIVPSSHRSSEELKAVLPLPPIDTGPVERVEKRSLTAPLPPLQFPEGSISERPMCPERERLWLARIPPSPPSWRSPSVPGARTSADRRRLAASALALALAFALGAIASALWFQRQLAAPRDPADTSARPPE